MANYHKLSPNHFLFWEEIKEAHHDGFKIYDFGRTSPTNTSLMNFKGHWGTEVTDLPVFYYPATLANQANHRENSLVYKAVSQSCRVAPVPFLHLIGRFCYNHLG